MRLTIAIVLLIPAIAHAAAPSLEQARAAYAEADNDRALALLDQATHEAPNDTEWTAIYELMTTIHAAYGRREDARDAMLQLIERNPRYVPPDKSSPKILEAYGAARALYERAHPQLVLTPPVPLPPSTPVYERAWFWIAAGGVVAALGTYLAVRYANPGTPAGDFTGGKF